MIDIPKAYEPKSVEEKWYSFWLQNKYFHAEEKSDKNPFCIVIPPPNVTGSLHIGHALDNTFQDILIRRKRMQGYNALWVPGTDHAGIITQHVMEKFLAEEGTSRQEIGREKFIERMWKWKEESRGTIISQLMKLGCSCDWDRERFTLDEGLSRAVRTEFKLLYDEGLIYRGAYIVNWCPRCETALSDLEVEHVETQGYLYHVRYDLADGSGELIIATTRPETMLGDTGVAVNPHDERYRHLVGSEAILPIVGRRLRIVGDEAVDPEFGTGVLKVTPSHDPADFEIGIRHGLPQLNVMNPDGTMNDAAGKFAGLDRYECRKAIVRELKETGHLIKIEDYTHAVGNCERCKTPIEPLISEQWFMRMKEIAARAIEGVRNKEVRFVPEMWEKEFYNWMENIRDWCISRQIWWGHRIPVWTCQGCGREIVEVETPEKCPDCGSGELKQDPDVLDTWFSSALWPFSTLGWPDETDLYKTFYPTSVLVTAWDILFFWVARMIMMGLKLTGQAPFKYVYLHPLVADEEGKKMSKSRGNVIDPLSIMEESGTDAFRFALTAAVIPSRYMQLPASRIEGSRNFTNKIWNASRFVIMNLESFEPDNARPLDSLPLQLCDRWILSKYNRVVKAVNDAIEEFRFENAAQAIYEFMWHEFCDWYVELTKIRLYDSDEPEEKYTARFVLWHLLEGMMRLMHPIMPFITEEIWQMLPHDGESIVVASYPAANGSWINEKAESDMALLMEIISSVRNIRSEMQIPPSRRIRLLLQVPDDGQRKLVSDNVEYISFLARADEIVVEPAIKRPEASATAVVGNIEVFVPLAGVIDIDREIARIRKEIEKAQNGLIGIDKKLSNDSFVTKAPAHIVARERERKTELEQTIAKLRKNLSFFEQT